MRKAPTSAEAKLWIRLRRRQIADCRFRRQHPVGPYVADFACVARKVIVEIDGATHSTEAAGAHDRQRTEFLEAEGWKVVRASNVEVYENLGAFGRQHESFPSPSHLRRGIDAPWLTM